LKNNVGVVLLGPSVGIKEGSIAKEHNVSASLKEESKWWDV
jgi:hypothetical protein